MNAAMAARRERFPHDASTGARRGDAPTDMSYVCARVRARLPRLWTAEQLERLRLCPTLAELLPYFLSGEYAMEAKTRLLDPDDLDAWDAVLMSVYVRRATRVREWIDEGAPSYSHLFGGEWDLHHVRALVRHVFRKTARPGADPGRPPRSPREPESRGDEDRPPGSPETDEAEQSLPREIHVALGDFSRQQCERLATARSLVELFRRMEEWRPEWGAELRRCVERRGPDGATLEELELSLENLYFQRLEACARHAATREDRVALRQWVAWRIDAANLRTSLRFLGRGVSPATIAALHVPGGSLSRQRFAAMMGADALEQLHRQLPRGPLTKALDRGTLAYANVGRVSVFARLLEEQQLLLERRLARGHPLSVIVPLHYAARLRNEWLNLRMIARGIHFGLPAGKVRGNLIYV